MVVPEHWVFVILNCNGTRYYSNNLRVDCFILQFGLIFQVHLRLLCTKCMALARWLQRNFQISVPVSRVAFFWRGERPWQAVGENGTRHKWVRMWEWVMSGSVTLVPWQRKRGSVRDGRTVERTWRDSRKRGWVELRVELSRKRGSVELSRKRDSVTPRDPLTLPRRPHTGSRGSLAEREAKKISSSCFLFIFRFSTLRQFMHWSVQDGERSKSSSMSILRFRVSWG